MLRIQAEALTFDDVSLVPAHSTVLPKDVSLGTQLTRGIRLNLPIVSAAMDTVTESRLAIAMAQLGGIGILHKNMSLVQQAAHVAQVKQFEAGVIRDPFTVSPTTTPVAEPMEAPAHVSFVEGAATLERDGRPDPSLLNMPLLSGDRIRTQSGRVEVLFGDGSVLHVDSGTVIDFQSDDVMRLLGGRVRLAIHPG